MGNPKKRTKPEPKTKTPKERKAQSPAFQKGSDPLAVVPRAVTSLPQALVSYRAEPAAFDIRVAEKHAKAYAERLAAIPPDRIRILRLDTDAVCGAALTVHSLTQVPEVRARYEAAAKAGEFVLSNLDDLRALPFIILDMRRQAKAAGAFATDAKVPADIVEKSAEVEARMEKVCEHCFWDDPELGPLVQSLRPGTSYQDRAYDLFGYADIYTQQHKIVSGDAHYRSTDVADARQLAGKILAAISATMSPEARASYDTLQRAWTLLEVVYGEVRELGLRFLRADPLRDQRFPSLYVVGRASTGRKKAKPGDAKAAANAKAGAEAKGGGDGAAAGANGAPGAEAKAAGGEKAAADAKATAGK